MTELGNHFAGSPRFDGGAAARDSTAAQQGWLKLLATHDPQTAAARVKGEFAVAMREPSGRCFLAVDRFATHSLCYRVRGNQLYFSPRADALGEGSELDPQALFDYLYFHIIPSPRTVFQGVHRLPPGHCAVFENGKLTVSRYWSPAFTEPRSPNFTQLKEKFHRQLTQSVVRQLDGTTPACFLSGGTDSSTVTGMICKVAGRPAAAYSIGFEADGYDEMEYARVAARHFGAEHHEYYVTPEDLITSIPRVAAYYDQPFGNSSALPSFYCAMKAREDGVTRILAGDGGDELFGGNTRYAQQRLFTIYNALPKGLRSSVMEPIFNMGALQHVPVLKRGAGYIRQANTPLPARMQIFNLLKRLGYAEILTPQMLAQVSEKSVADQQRAVWNEVQGTTETNQHLAYDWRYTLAECDLPKVRGTTALAGMAVGFPMLDDDLLDFSLGLPSEYKLKRYQLRWFFKEALRGFLPDEVIAKKKQGFGLPYGVWLTRHAGLKDQAMDAMQAMAQRGIVKSTFVNSLVGQRLPEAPGYYGTLIWILVMLEHWLRVHAPGYRLR
jgi:asparagine synthase (glutamine-hydrolysing)